MQDSVTSLDILDRYIVTIVEQAFMDTLDPSLNMAPYSNASFPNLGATGMVRDEVFKDLVSLSHQGRIYHPTTVELHRVNGTGRKMSPETRAKMSAANAGVQVLVTDVATGKVTTFDTKSKACADLSISMRTLGRWLDKSQSSHPLKDGRRVIVKLS